MLCAVGVVLELLRRRSRLFSADSIGAGDDGIVAIIGVGLNVTERASRGPGPGGEAEEGRSGVVSEVVRDGIVARYVVYVVVGLWPCNTAYMLGSCVTGCSCDVRCCAVSVVQRRARCNGLWCCELCAKDVCDCYFIPTIFIMTMLVAAELAGFWVSEVT